MEKWITMPETRAENTVFAFTSGEVSEKFASRIDVAKVTLACRTLVNFKVGAFGQADRRKGFRFIAATKESEGG